MAFRDSHPGNEAISRSSQLETGFKDLLRMGGGFGTVSGPGLFMARVVVAGTISSVVTGMFGASIGAIFYDTAAIPFVVSACSGFLIGAFGFYRDAARKSLASLDRYPRLLQLHLDANFPHRDFHSWTSSQLRSAYFRQSWILQSMLIASWLTSASALDRILEAQEEAILQQHVQNTEDTDGDGKGEMKTTLVRT